MTTLTITLTNTVHEALEKDAATKNLQASDYATRLIEDHLSAQGLLDETVAVEIALARSLIDRAIDEALSIVNEQGFRSSITYDTIQAVTADPDWLRDYAKLVGDDPFKTGVRAKQTINQNLGYFIKKALRAESERGGNKRPANVKVTGSIIQSYTPLKR